MKIVVEISFAFAVRQALLYVLYVDLILPITLLGKHYYVLSAFCRVEK